jgi:hypothetical protein
MKNHSIMRIYDPPAGGATPFVPLSGTMEVKNAANTNNANRNNIVLVSLA